MPKRRSFQELKTSGERLRAIMSEVSDIQTVHQTQRAHVLSSQENLRIISASMNATLDKQDKNLEKLKLTLAR